MESTAGWGRALSEEHQLEAALNSRALGCIVVVLVVVEGCERLRESVPVMFFHAVSHYHRA